jgi:CheY-like chemotaxis protein
MTVLELVGITVGAGGFTTVLTLLINKIADRKKTRSEAEKIANEVMSMVLESVKNQLTQSNSRMAVMEHESDNDKKKISDLEKQLDTHQQANQECQLSNSLLLVELEAMRKMIMEKSIPIQKIKIAILDDNSMDKFMFEHRLKRVSFLDVHAFTDVDSFMKSIESRPDILIMDYHLGSGMTVESLITKILSLPNYDPKIVVITGDRTAELRESLSKLGVWRFFVKEGPYVNLVTKTILDYLENFLK